MKILNKTMLALSGLGVAFGLDLHTHAHNRKTFSDGAVHTKEPLKIKIAFQFATRIFNNDAAGRRVVDHGCRQAAGQGVQDIFNRVGSLAFAQKKRWFGVVENKRALGVGLLVAGATEAADGRAVVIAAQPGVRGAKLKISDFRCLFYRLNGFK